MDMDIIRKCSENQLLLYILYTELPWKSPPVSETSLLKYYYYSLTIVFLHLPITQQLDKLLSCQKLASEEIGGQAVHDELLFIVTHQGITELDSRLLTINLQELLFIVTHQGITELDSRYFLQ